MDKSVRAFPLVRSPSHDALWTPSLANRVVSIWESFQQGRTPANPLATTVRDRNLELRGAVGTIVYALLRPSRLNRTCLATTKKLLTIRPYKMPLVLLVGADF